MKYSCLIVTKEKDDLLQKIEKILKDGIKIILFCENINRLKLQEMTGRYKYFRYYTCNLGDVSETIIEDGRVKDKDEPILKSLSKKVPEFNLEQYMVEHAGITRTIVVKASAGTGKTTVMVDRIMYLLSTVPNLEPKEICMITFTNKAAQSMREKLYKKIMEFYLGSRQFRYLELLEKITEIQVSTIDSLFFSLIRRNGIFLGYGDTAKIRGMVREKKDIIRDVINNHFKDYSGDFLDKRICTINDYLDISYACWQYLNERGYYYDDIKGIDFGADSDWAEKDFSESLIAGFKKKKNGKRPLTKQKYIEQAKEISTNLKDIILEADELYRKKKKILNATTMSDITSDLIDVIKNTNKTKSDNYKFMFVDEFQDTDDSQIKSLVRLKEALNCQLFVVGDVKQSIYRFRGAEETAFEKLEDLLPKGDCSIQVLLKNYRTQNNILQIFNKIFRSWSEKKLLPWDGDLISPLVGSGNFKGIAVEQSRDIEEAYINILEKYLQDDDEICTLVRTNFQAKKLARLCRKNKIPCLINKSSGFYGTRPVLDLFHFVAAILFPKDNKRLFNFLLTPYSIVKPDLTKISSFEGDEAKLARYLTKLCEENNLEVLVGRAKNIPVFQLLREIIEEYDPVSNYAVQCRMELERIGFAEEKLRTQLEYEKRSYLINLDKIMGIIGDNLGSEYVALLDIYDFLKMKILTDDEEDVLYPELDKELNKKIVKIMTVHNAKGLEFDTVVMPYTNRKFYKDISESGSKHEFMIYGEDKCELGWRVALPSNVDFCNVHYDKNKGLEYEAVTREELRVLYVALTRAKNRLTYIYPKRNRNSSWSAYL